MRNLVGIAGKPHAEDRRRRDRPRHRRQRPEFGLRVDVQPETAAVAPLVDALAEYALSLRESEDGEGK